MRTTLVRAGGIALLALAAGVLGGCFKFDPKINVDVGGGTGGWADIIGGRILGAEYGAIFYSYDTLAYPGKSVDLVARLQKAKNLRPLPGVPLLFEDADGMRIGIARTDKDGRATTSWTPPRAGDYHFTVRVLSVPEALDDEYRAIDRIQPTPLLVAARAKDAKFVIIDLDHTVVDGSFFRVLFLGNARPMADSVQVTRRIAGSYSILYLTHRPDLMTRPSKSWLREHGYPAGPLMVSTVREAFGDSGEFKTAKLSRIRKVYPHVRIGIGDKLSDAKAYVDNRMTAYLLPHYKDKPKDMRKIAGQIDKLPDRGRLNVVSNWRAVEAGIFAGKRFEPRAFTRSLRARADQIERDKRRKDREDDDDDDDDDD